MGCPGKPIPSFQKLKNPYRTGKKPVLTIIYEFDECHLAGILANKADESLKEKLDLVDHLCENTFWNAKKSVKKIIEF